MHMIAEDKDYQRPVMLASLLISFLMLGGKLVAYFITGSTAILSDALESVIHLFATGFAGFSLWYSVQPPDEKHPYGHGKIAYFSSGFEGALIMIAAFAIIYTAVVDLIKGPELRSINIGLWITGALAFVNLGLGTALVRTGKKHNSVVLIANGHHVFTDMWTSFGVIVGLFLVWLTDILWLDPVVAIILGLNILWTARALMRNAFAGLMEEANPEDTTQIVDLLDKAVEKNVIQGYHQLRHRRINHQVFIEYHVTFPENDSIESAHAKSHEVEDDLHKLFPQDTVVVTAHLEPMMHHEAHENSHPEPHLDPLVGDKG